MRRPLAWKRHRVLSAYDAVLGSYPRSGGTWLSIMLGEHLTGTSFDLRSGDDALPMVGEGTPQLSIPGGGWLYRSHEPYRREYRRPIVLVRDPRDVVISYFHFQRDRLEIFDGTLPEFVDGFVAGTIDHYGAWNDHVDSWLAGGDDRVVVRYEELRADPARELQRILDFLGIEWDAARLEHVAQANSFDRMREKEQVSSEATPEDRPDSARFVRAGHVGGWRESLDEDSLRKLEHAMSTTMRRVGYEPTT